MSERMELAKVQLERLEEIKAHPLQVASALIEMASEVLLSLPDTSGLDDAEHHLSAASELIAIEIRDRLG